MRFLVAILPLLIPSAEAYRPGDAKRAARAGFAAPKGHEDEHHPPPPDQPVPRLAVALDLVNRRAAERPVRRYRRVGGEGAAEGDRGMIGDVF